MNSEIKNLKKCIIIPCYNEEKRINADRFIAFAKVNPEIQICFVNDGSTDQTLRVLEESFRLPQFEVINLAKNRGKAEAVRQGVLANLDAGVLGYFDADLSTPLEEFVRLAAELKGDVQFVFGSRILTVSANIVRSSYRHYFGRIIATFISNILKLPIYDTQCGAKVFSSEIARTTFSEPFSSPWLFDVEIFARLIQKFGYTKVRDIIKEQPLLEWIEAGDSRITVMDMIKVPVHLLKIKLRYRF